MKLPITDWDALKTKQRIVVDKYNRSQSSSNKRLYSLEILDIERELEKLR